MSADLVVWLRAQLDEDERATRDYERHLAERAAGAGSYVVETPPGWGRGEPFDPARVLAEVESTRLILEYAEDAIRGWTSEDAKELARDILKALALPFADRPGYLEEWRP